MNKSAATQTRDIMNDLTWVDLVKGIAIIGVFFDNWHAYMDLAPTPHLHYLLANTFLAVVGPFVQVFFILSGFGLTLNYLAYQGAWSWKKWAWRRFTKIVVPYQIIVLASFVLGIVGSYLYLSVNMDFSWTELLTYAIFAQNFFRESWAWNPPLWFMPVIIGLYIVFPLMVKILEKGGPWKLLLISAVITYGTITVGILVRRSGGHSSDIFTFWLIQFALGMVLAYQRATDPQKLRHLIGVRAFGLGLGLFGFSWVMKTYMPLGKAYNDLFTSVGIFLLLLNLGWLSRLWMPILGQALISLSSKSYLMYLVHYPIMAFLIGPVLKEVISDPLVIVLAGGIYIAAIFLLCAVIAQPINRLSAWLYQLPGHIRAREPAQAVPH